MNRKTTNSVPLALIKFFSLLTFINFATPALAGESQPLSYYQSQFEESLKPGDCAVSMLDDVFIKKAGDQITEISPAQAKQDPACPALRDNEFSLYEAAWSRLQKQKYYADIHTTVFLTCQAASVSLILSGTGAYCTDDSGTRHFVAIFGIGFAAGVTLPDVTREQWSTDIICTFKKKDHISGTYYGGTVGGTVRIDGLGLRVGKFRGARASGCELISDFVGLDVNASVATLVIY